MARKVDWEKMNRDLDEILRGVEKEIDDAYNKKFTTVEINRGSQYKLPRIYTTLSLFTEDLDLRTISVGEIMKKYGLIRYHKNSFHKSPSSITYTYGLPHDNYKC